MQTEKITYTIVQTGNIAIITATKDGKQVDVKKLSVNANNKMVLN